MLVTNKYIFHYDAKKAAAKHSKYLAHDGQVCTAYLDSNDKFIPHDVLNVMFEDGFSANVYFYELEEI